ncbi:MAG: YHYH protein [Phycisphaerales bacterium]|nr:YHYH protein [Planctomycetota bacterium]
MKTRPALFCLICFPLSVLAQEPTLTTWRQNATGAKGQSSDTFINNVLSTILADVQQVRSTATSTYINATGVPAYPIGPWPSNPNTPSNQNILARFPRTPQAQSGTHTATGLGAIGLWIDGVEIFNAKDARSYQNKGIWNQNAVIVEGPSFDSAGGHPAPGGAYHHHQTPTGLRVQLGDNGTRHSPLLGYAFDGFPIYGPYGYANPNGSGGVVRMDSSYRKRSITTRTTLPNGTVLTAANYGPVVSTQYPLGYYLEDFEYIQGLGHLDQYNGRFCITPDYPGGTYAYFTTIDASGSPAYPYILGPQYYGVLATDNTSHSVSVPGTAVKYCEADISCDGQIDDADFALFAPMYDILLCTDSAMSPGCPADLNHDGAVDDQDFVLFASAYDAYLCL